MADNPYLEDDDETQDELESNAPTAPSSSPQSALRDYLLQRMQQADRGTQFDASKQNNSRQIETDLAGKLAMNEAFAKAASQAGSLGGKMASTEPISTATNQLLGAQKTGIGMEQQQKGEQDKLNEYLTSKLNQQDMLQQKLDAQQGIAKTKAGVASEANKTKLSIAQLGADKKRYQSVGQDDDGNLVVMDVQTGKVHATDQPISKVGATSDGSNPKDIKRLDDLSNMTVTGGKNAADFKQHQQVVTNADKILQMEAQMTSQKGGLDKRQIEEVAIASANLLANGSGGALATIQALVPHSVGTDAAGIKEWLTSEPTGTNQQAFVTRMFETAKREKHLAVEKLKSYRADMLGNYSDLAGNPRYEGLKKRYFGADDKFDPDTGAYIQKPFGMQGLGQPQPQAGGSGQAVAAPGGNQLPPKPKTVIQDGHTYTLNPQTGNYE